MLNTGLIVNRDNNLFNSVLLDSYISEMKKESTVSKPNQRLINQFAEFMKDQGYKIFRGRLHFITGNQRIVSWDYPGAFLRKSRVILSSNPVAGKSYLKVTILSTGVEGQFSYEFIASSPLIIYQKLLHYKLIDPDNRKGIPDNCKEKRAKAYNPFFKGGSGG